MIFLGIDQSLTKPGITILNEDAGIIISRSVSVSKSLRGAARLMFIADALREDLSWPCSQHEAGVGCIEGASFGSFHREFDLGEVSGVVKLVAFELGLDLITVAPTQLKLFATGKGNHANTQTNPKAGKAAVIHGVKTEWGVDFEKDDDAADSYVLARIAWAIHTKKFTKRCQADVVMKLLQPVEKKSTKHKVNRQTNI
jgi:Holliday junction resolvasome RuvABC endonuclease subunit